MITAKNFVITLCGVLLAFFLLALALCVFYAPKSYIGNILIAQFVLLSLTACSIILFCTIPKAKKGNAVSQKVSKIVLLSDSNSLMDEYSLIDRTSGIICKGVDISFDSLGTNLSSDECAVVNCVKDFWYLERLTDEKNVGLKQAGEQYVYKLRTGVCYKLHINDIIYIENERLLVL